MSIHCQLPLCMYTLRGRRIKSYREGHQKCQIPLKRMCGCDEAREG